MVRKTVIYIECGEKPFLYTLEDVDYLPRVTETIYIYGDKYYIEEIWHEFTNDEHGVYILVSEME